MPMLTDQINQLGQSIANAKKIVVIQADNPDGDSLGSALSLEQALTELGKEVFLYCGVDMPTYLHYLSGWSRVSKELPQEFDISIIVDTSANNLVEKLEKTGQSKWLRLKPCFVIDHHPDVCDIDYVTTVICDPSCVSTGELLSEVFKQLEIDISLTTAEYIAGTILSDSLGLTTEAVTAKSVYTLAEMIKKGVSLAELNDRRLEYSKKPIEVIKYKGELLQRIEYFYDNKIAIVMIPWDEIKEVSPIYNPAILFTDEMRMAEGVAVAIAIKSYPTGR